MLASPRDIWINAMICIMPCIVSRYQTKTCIVILQVDILPCDEMQYLLKYLKCVLEMCISYNDIKIILHSFTCWYLTIWWIVTITIIQTCNVKFENECQALTSSSERYIMMGIMMGVLISSNDLTY